jgi:DNA-binding NtrC family response regulator
MGSIRDAEARAISEALEKAGGNKRKAARLLGIAPSTLYAKMKQYGI